MTLPEQNHNERFQALNIIRGYLNDLTTPTPPPLTLISNNPSVADSKVCFSALHTNTWAIVVSIFWLHETPWYHQNEVYYKQVWKIYKHYGKLYYYCVLVPRTQPLICVGCFVQLVREVFSRLHSSSSSTHICLALRRLLTFCLTLTGGDSCVLGVHLSNVRWGLLFCLRKSFIF